jgi:long-chain acyl-CoA synthetase
MTGTRYNCHIKVPGKERPAMINVREEVRKFVFEHVINDSDQSVFTDDTNLKECGVLDSFSALNLVSFIEDRFDVQLEAADVESGRLFSLNGIEELVRSKRAAVQANNGHLAGVYEYFRAAALSHQDDLAIVDGNCRITYRELLARTHAFSETLSEAGLRAGDTVALVLGNNRGFIVALLAAWKCGLVVIPLNPQLPAGESLKFLLDIRPNALVTSARNGSLPISLREKGTPLDHVFLYSPTDDSWIQESTTEERDRLSIDSPPRLPTQTDWPALTQYSTGSTGTPKRVTRSHGQLVREFVAVSSVLSLTPDDRVLGIVPFFHSHGLKNAALLPLLAGAALYVLDSFFPRDVATLMQREKITVFPGVPFMFQQLANLREHYDLSSLRLTFSGSAPLPQTTTRAFESVYGIRIRRVYGTTETGLISVEREAGIVDDLNRAGVPVPGVTVEIVDGTGAPIAPGNEGRVKVTSPFAPLQYDRTDAGSASFFSDGSYFPGDMGRLLESGELVLTGRDRGFINVGGNKVDAREVEAVLLEIPGVSEVVVLGLPDAVYGERIKAVVVAPDQLTSKEVRAHLIARLAEFKHPRIIEFRKEIPRGALGKVERKSLTGE